MSKEDEARARRFAENYNATQAKQRADAAERSKKAYSRKIASIGAMPPIIGPGVDRPTYERELRRYNANQKMWGGSNTASSGWGGGSGGGSSGTPAAGLGKLMAVLLVFGFIMYIVSQGHNKQTSGADEPVPQVVPLSPAAADSQIAAKASPIPQTEASTGIDRSPATAGNATVAPADEKAPSSESVPSGVQGTKEISEIPKAKPDENSYVPYENIIQVQMFMAGSTPGPIHLWAKHKGSGGCSGLLTLTASDLTFQCSNNEADNVRFARVEILNADDDGIRVNSGRQEYHFKIAAVDKKEVKALFAEWFRRTASIQASR